jgi:hypothetical protein
MQRDRFSPRAVPQAGDSRFAADRNKIDRPLDAGLKANCGARCDIETHSVRRVAVKNERIVHFKKMRVRTDLNRPITVICNVYRCTPAPRAQFDRSRHWENLARLHGIGS